MSGTLYIVSTPIGNLEDITYRAIRVLKKCDMIVSEDTRETSKLISKYSIEKPQMVYNDHNHTLAFPRIKDLLEDGKTLCLVSDSGTPLISDPGFKLVREIKKLGIKVVPIPGASSVTSALSVSGLPSDKFTFLGFLPKTSGRAGNILKEYGNLDSTLIILESPYRIQKLLELISETLGNREVCLARELTKTYEEVITAPVEDLKKLFETKSPKGEFVVLISKENGSKDL